MRKKYYSKYITLWIDEQWFVWTDLLIDEQWLNVWTDL